MKTPKEPRHFFIESQDTVIHRKLLTYKANSFRIKKKGNEALHNKYNLENAYSGRLYGKVTQGAAYGGEVVWKNQKLRLWEPARHTRFQFFISPLNTL